MNNINWKEVSQSPGYKSLKAAYAWDIRKKNRSKQEVLKHFNWVISRAKHYAHKRNVTLDVILNEWEGKRDYWWLNYYQEWNFPWMPVNPRLRSSGTTRRSLYYKRLSSKDKLEFMRRKRAEAKRVRKSITQS